MKKITITTFLLISLSFSTIHSTCAKRCFPFGISTISKISKSSWISRLRGGDNNNDIKKDATATNIVSKNMYNNQANNWVRTEPTCLSDFTGRPVVFNLIAEEIASLEKKNNECSDSGDRDILVCDVGCGEGYCARKVVELGASKVIGIDISEEMINCAKEVSKGDDRFRYVSGSGSSLIQILTDQSDYFGIKDVREGIADIAIAVFLFNYLTTIEMKDVISQIFNTVKSGGAFIFSVPHPSMIYCHDKDAIFHLNSQGKGYFSSKNEKLYGQISRIDGTKLNIMSVHKTLNDYICAILDTGFQIEDIQEAGVTEEHMMMNSEFFDSVNDRPLHLIFLCRKP